MNLGENKKGRWLDIRRSYLSLNWFGRGLRLLDWCNGTDRKNTGSGWGSGRGCGLHNGHIGNGHGSLDHLGRLCGFARSLFLSVVQEFLGFRRQGRGGGGDLGGAALVLLTAGRGQRSGHVLGL